LFNARYALVETKDDVTDAAVDKLCVALGGTVTDTLSFDPLLAVEHVIADAINKVGFWRRNHSLSRLFPPFQV
jgi:hypothetical protein